jgi:hypothetical protein
VGLRDDFKTAIAAAAAAEATGDLLTALRQMRVAHTLLLGLSNMNATGRGETWDRAALERKIADLKQQLGSAAGMTTMTVRYDLEDRDGCGCGGGA